MLTGPCPICGESYDTSGACQCGRPRVFVQGAPEPKPEHDKTGWICPRCQRVFAPFVAHCFFCQPRRNYEVLDPHIPRGDEAPRHGVSVTLPEPKVPESDGGDPE